MRWHTLHISVAVTKPFEIVKYVTETLAETVQHSKKYLKKLGVFPMTMGTALDRDEWKAYQKR